MSSFFDSEIVQEEMKEIHELQSIVYNTSQDYASLNREDKIEHIDNLTELLDLQRVMYTRLALSDDSNAKKMKAELEKSVILLGFPAGTDISVLFSGMSQTIESLRQGIDY
tara:strand:+ start:77 stop:409 length:333 start_codon:yes stop_codon:yes gene_type:complete